MLTTSKKSSGPVALARIRLQAMRASLIFFAVVSAADVVSTWYGLRHYAAEGNSLMRPLVAEGIPGMLVPKIILGVGITALAVCYKAGWGRYLVYAAALVTAVGVMHNVLLLI